MYIIVLAVVAVGIWLFVRKSGTQQSDLYGGSVSPTVSATPAATATGAAPVGTVITLPDGLNVKDEVVGTGATAAAGDTVAVQYTGTLTSGKKFDSSYDHGGQPFSFQLGAGQVIKGWDEGVAGMKVGGKRILTIPPELAYGSQDVGNGLIPANSTLIFEVELMAVKGK